MKQVYIFNVFLCIVLFNTHMDEVNCEINNDLIKVVVDFIDSQKLAKVSAFLCWNSKNLVNLMKQMSNKYIPISIKRVSMQVNKDITYSEPVQHQMYLLDIDCENAENILQNADKNHLLKPPFRWAIVKDCENQHDFSKYEIFLGTRIYVINKCKNSVDKYEIVSIYNHKKNESTVANKVALWRNGFEYNRKLLDYRDRLDQGGYHFNISQVILFNESLNDLEAMRVRKRDPLTKHNYQLMLCLLDVLNASATFISHGSWGVPDPVTKKYNGIVGDVFAGISEITGSPIFILADKMPYVDYISDTTATEGSFIFRAPPLSTVTNIFRLPFTSMVWLACFILLAIILFVMYCIIKWEWSEMKYQEEHGANKSGVLQPTLIDIVQMEIGAVCQQGAEGEPKSPAGRIAFFFILLSLMFLYTAYSANIVALLQSTTDSLKDLKDLYEANIEFGFQNISYNIYHVKNQKGKYQQLVYNRANPHGFVDIGHGVDRMRKEFYAIFAEVDAIYKLVSDTFMEHEKCGLTMVKYWNVLTPWLAAKKNSTFKEIFKTTFLLIKERGINDRNFWKVYSQKPSCQNQGASFTSVSVNDCYFAMVVFLAGVLLSLLILAAEKAFEKKHAFFKFKFNHLAFDRTKSFDRNNQQLNH